MAPSNFEVDIEKHVADVKARAAEYARPARTKLDDAIFILTRQEPFYNFVFSGLQRVQDIHIPIAAVSFNTSSLSFQLHYNPISFSQLDVSVIVPILKHELLHIIFGHVTRGILYPNHMKFNYAADMVVDQYCDMPKSVKIDGQELFFIFPPQDAIPFESTEYYYSLLPDNDDVCSTCGASIDKNNQQDKDANQNNKRGENNNQCDQQDNQDGKQDTNESPSDNTDSNTPNNNDTQKCPKCGSKASQPKEFISHVYWRDADYIIKEVSDDIRKSIIARGQLAGNVPQDLQKTIEKILPKKVISWEKILKNGISDEYAESYQEVFSRRNRRIKELIGSIPGKVRDKMVHAYIGVDVSGSICDEQLQKLLGVVEQIFQKVNMEATTIYCSAMIHHIEPFRKCDKYERHGSGGTAFTPVLEYVKAQKMPNKILIYLTDGYGDSPDGEPYRSFKTIWVVNNNDATPANFGQIIRMEE